ncbi:NLRC3 [Symbiodinium sp. CCMP2592]|nr:NLRC3 [Symbiodinium sp. CCMP2592]
MGNGPCTQFDQSIFDVIPYEAIWFDLDTPETLFDYLIYADIRLVRFEYLKQLVADRRLWPRRQEAEYEKIAQASWPGTRDALVTMEEVQQQRQLSRAPNLHREMMKGFEEGCREEGETDNFMVDMFGMSSRDPALARTISASWEDALDFFGGVQSLRNRISRQGLHQVHLLTVSHCWESKQHPDPWGSQLQRLVNIISAYQEAVFEATGVENAECWIVIDFICLPQYPRNTVQQQCFQRAMKSMHMLYAHNAVDRVVRLEEPTSDFEKLFAPNFIDIYHEDVHVQHHRKPTKPTHPVPEKAGRFGPQPFSALELNSTPYTARGWCIAETQWMSASNCIHGYAPMLPATFQKRVQETALKFTHRSDATAVMQLQEMVFWKKAKACRELDVAWLPHDEFLLLTEALPHYVNLRELRIFHCDIRSELAVALVNVVRSLGDLSLVRMIQCSISDEAAAVFADFFSNVEQHRSSVEGCCCGVPHTAMRLSLLNCQVGGVGRAVLAEAGLQMLTTPASSFWLWLRFRHWALLTCACDRRSLKAQEGLEFFKTTFNKNLNKIEDIQSALIRDVVVR